MGNVASAFTDPDDTHTKGDDTDVISDMSFIVSYVILIAVSLFVFSYIFYAFWQHLAENIITDLRKRYIAALMQQEVAFFEKNRVEELPAQINEVFETVKASIGEKIANLMFANTTCIAGIVYALGFGPEFALICIAYLPLLMATIAVFGMRVKNMTS